MTTPDQLQSLLPDADIEAINNAIPTEKHLKAIEHLDKVYDALIETKAFNIKDEYKRRDQREPHRTIKEAFEDKIKKLIKRLFSRQKKNVLDRITLHTQFIQEAPKLDDPEIYKDDETEAMLVLVFLAMALDANEIFIDETNIPQDEYSSIALDAARKAVGFLIKNINDTTRMRVQEAVALFVDTPGMTLKQLADLLPFPDYRARLITITEVSNLYGEMNNRNAELLAKRFPGMEVFRTWFTNNDPNVCPICKGLNGKQAVWPKPFISDFDGGEYFRPSDPHPGCRCWTSTSVRERKK